MPIRRHNAGFAPAAAVFLLDRAIGPSHQGRLGRTQEAECDSDEPHPEDHLQDGGLDGTGDDGAQHGQGYGDDQQGSRERIVDQTPSHVREQPAGETEDLGDQARSDGHLGRDTEDEKEERSEERGSFYAGGHRDGRDDDRHGQHEPVLERHYQHRRWASPTFSFRTTPEMCARTSRTTWKRSSSRLKKASRSSASARVGVVATAS